MYTIETKEYKGFEIEIFQDDDACQFLFDDYNKNCDGHKDYYTTVGAWNGYELFDDEVKYLGEEEVLCHYFWSNYYNEIVKDNKKLEYSDYLSDYDYPDDSPLSLQQVYDIVQKWIDKNIIMLPIYVYEHSGITMRTSGFGCQWDSGQAGYIYTDKKRAKDWLSVKRLTKKNIATVESYMHSEIEHLADLCEGNVYGYTWEHGGCGGFVGDTDDMLKEVYSEIEYYIADEHKKVLAYKKNQIKNRVPAQYRDVYEIA